MLRSVDQSSDGERSLLRLFCRDCITTIRGYDFQEGQVLTATNTMIAELAQNWSTPEGQQLIQLLFTDVLPAISR